MERKGPSHVRHLTCLCYIACSVKNSNEINLVQFSERRFIVGMASFVYDNDSNKLCEYLFFNKGIQEKYCQKRHIM